MGNDVVKFLPATDIYALGATLYKLLTGVTPPSANLLASGEELAPFPAPISASCRKVIDYSMILNRKKRLQAIKEFLCILDDQIEQADDVTIIDANRLSESVVYGSTADIHEYVDLGLSVRWATCNVGASTPSDYGDYFAWGEIYPKRIYTEGSSCTSGMDLGDISGSLQYDAARGNWGEAWRLPTLDEIKDLKEKCKWRWDLLNGCRGFRVTGPNGNSIFLPASGYRYGAYLNGLGVYGRYWTSTPNEDDMQYAFGFYFDEKNIDWYWYFRYLGRSIRPVSD